MAVFDRTLGGLDAQNPAEAVRMLVDHIRHMQEQLEYALANLDSSNVIEISTDATTITGGGVALTGEELTMTGTNGEGFRVGTAGGVFRFEVKDRGGAVLYLDGQGRLVIGRRAEITVDGGEW